MADKNSLMSIRPGTKAGVDVGYQMVEIIFTCDDQLDWLIWSSGVLFLQQGLNALDNSCQWDKRPGGRASGPSQLEPLWASSHLLELSCAGCGALLKCQKMLQKLFLSTYRRVKAFFNVV